MERTQTQNAINAGRKARFAAVLGLLSEPEKKTLAKALTVFVQDARLSIECGLPQHKDQWTSEDEYIAHIFDERVAEGSSLLEIFPEELRDAQAEEIQKDTNLFRTPSDTEADIRRAVAKHRRKRAA